MNKICKVVSIALSTSLFSTMLTPTVAYADDTIDSATELISATIELAATGVESATYDTALETVLNNISVNGEEVSYEGTVIGYYNTSTPTTLYGDAEKTSPVISQKAEGFIVEPSLLRTLVSDFNEGLIDTYSPTDVTDWSKIIGKYDVTFNDKVTIPANQWITLNGGDVYKFTAETGLNVVGLSSYGSLLLIPWAMSPSGELYLGGEFTRLDGQSSSYSTFLAGSGNTQSYTHHPFGASDTSFEMNTYGRGYIELSLQHGNVTNQKTVMHPTIKFTSSDLVSTTSYSTYTNKSCYMYSIYDPTTYLSRGPLSETDYTTGLAYALIRTNTSDHTLYSEFFAPNPLEVTKTTVGNATLNARLAKLNGLTVADELTVTHAAWFVGETNIDDFLGETAVMEAGGQADIDTPTEIDPMSFNVIVPSSLPIKVDNLGEVYVADNAVISNYSCAAVTIKSVTVTPKPDTGWTMVAENPSKKRDAKEFTFDTSLTDGIDIGVDENLSFTYSAALSPLTEGTDSLDLVTVSVVVDWAEEDNT